MSPIQLVAAAYLLIGCLISICMFRLFPPVKGYRPPGLVRITAFLVYVVLWPFILLLGVVFGVGTWCRHQSGEESLPGNHRLARHRWHFSAAYNDIQGRN